MASVPQLKGLTPRRATAETCDALVAGRTQPTSYNKISMPSASKKELDDQIYEKQVRICKAFASTTRLRILDLLAKREHTVSGIEHALQIPKTNVSQHLAILKAAGVVATRREGKKIYCSMAIPEVKTACQLIRDVLRAQLRNGRRLPV